MMEEVMKMESEEKWVHRPDSAFNQSTKQVMTVIGVIFFLVLIIAIFFLKKYLAGQ